MSSGFWDRQESEKNSSHSTSHPLLVLAPAECGTPESKLGRHLQRSLKQEKSCIGTILSSCSSTDPHTVTAELTLASRQHPVEPPLQLVLCWLRSVGSLTVLIQGLWLPWAGRVAVGGFLEHSLRRTPANTKHRASQMSRA